MSNQTDNIRLVWKALNALTKYFSCKQNIPSTLTAEVFNDHLLSLAKTLTKTLGGGGGGEEYQCSDELKNLCTKRLKFDDTFIIPEITAYEVGKYVSSVGSKNTSGCDGISNKIIMLSLPDIVQHLTYVYNLCINHSCFPSDLKTAKVVPLPKTKDLNNVNNYRPISVLTSVSKPLEKHMHKHLLKYLDRFNLIHTHQSGFRPQHSCQSALTCLVDRLLSSINDSKLNGAVFLDLKKAFDLIDHQILLKKMKTYQLSGNAIQFF